MAKNDIAATSELIAAKLRRLGLYVESKPIFHAQR